MASTVKTDSLVKIGGSSGHSVVDVNSPLTRLNYFDGKFLRATDLIAEQQALRTQVHLSSQSGGGGLVHGYSCSESTGDALRITAGLGFDWQGRPLLLSQNIEIGMATLIDASRQNGRARNEAKASGGASFGACEIKEANIPPGGVLTATEFYLIVVSHLEAYCGEEDVYGKLCSEACVSDTQRSHIVEGIDVRAVPITLTLKTSSLLFDQRHLRSRAAAALFELERKALKELISSSGLKSNLWCQGAQAHSESGVPIALIGRGANSNLFVDSWSARRERIDTPPAQYWAARMMKRSVRTFNAHIAQFQCQLADCLSGISVTPGGDISPQDPCAETKALLSTSANEMDALLKQYAQAALDLPGVSAELHEARTAIESLSSMKETVLKMRSAALAQLDQHRMLINCGIVELPSAGYLPVAPNVEIPIEVQLKRMLGEGVDMRFCIVRPDFVAHAIEEVQHMERICLTTGIDDPANRQAIDILVPDGSMENREEANAKNGYETEVRIMPLALELGVNVFPGELNPETPIILKAMDSQRIADSTGAARIESEGSAGQAYLATTSAPVANRGNSLKELRVRSERGGTARGVGGLPEWALRHFGSGAMTDGQKLIASANQNAGIESNLWVELSSSDDPRQSSIGDKIRISADITLKLDNKKTPIERRTVKDAYLSVSSINRSGSNLDLEGRLDGQLEYSGMFGQGATPFSEAVHIHYVERGGLPQVTITVKQPSLLAGIKDLDLVVQYQQQDSKSMKTQMYITRSGVNTKRFDHMVRALTPGNTPLFQCQLQLNKAALTPGHAAHARALSAIKAIATTLKLPNLIDVAAKKLFGEENSESTASTVRATLPWVAFHRRRTKQCETDPVVKPETFPRSYHVFVMTLDNEHGDDELYELAKEDFSSLVQKYKTVPVRGVNYAHQSHSLTTPIVDLHNDWRAVVGPGSNIHLKVIATQGDALTEGVALATARMTQLSDALNSVTPSSDTSQQLALSQVPQGMVSGELSGVIVYAVRQQNVSCHPIYRIPSNDLERTIEELKGYFAENGSGTPLDDFVGKIEGHRVVDSEFINDTAEFFHDSRRQLLLAWRLENAPPIALPYSVKSSGSNSDAEDVHKQSKAILSALDTSDNGLTKEVLPSELMTDCGRATLLLTLIKQHDVYIALSLGSAIDAAEKYRSTISDIGFQDSWIEGDQTLIRLLGRSSFLGDSTQPDPSTIGDLITEWDLLLSEADGAELEVASIGIAYSVESDIDNLSRLKLIGARVDKLNTMVGIATAESNAVLQDPAIPFPDNPSSITLLVVGQKSTGPVTDISDRIIVSAPALHGIEDMGFSLDKHVQLTIRDRTIADDDALNILRRLIARSQKKVKRIDVISSIGVINPETRIATSALKNALATANLIAPRMKIEARKPNELESKEMARSGFAFGYALSVIV